MSKKTQIKIFVGILLTVVIVYYSAKSLGGLNPGILLKTHINWWIAGASAVIFAYANYIRGLAYTRGIDRQIDAMTAFRIIGIGHSANMVLPLHAGEGLRLAFFPESYSTPKRTKLILIPAVADFAAIIVLAMLAVPFAGFKNKQLLQGLQFVSLIFIGVAALIVALGLGIPKLHRYMTGYLNVSMLKMSFWVLLSWIVMLISIWLGLVAFGFGYVESARMSLSVFAATNIINFVPASPGGLGLFEYGVVLGLGGLGIPESPAKAAGILLHLIQYVALLPLGAVLFFTGFHRKPKR